MNSSWVLSELGAAWSLEKPILPVVTNRAVLNNIPIRVDQANIVEWIDEPGQADRFIDHVQQVLAHIHA